MAINEILNYKNSAYKSLWASNQQIYNTAAAKNTNAVNKLISELKSNAESDKNAYRKQTKSQIDALTYDYQKYFDKNEVERLVNLRKIDERMSNLGLSESGALKVRKAGANNAKKVADRSLQHDISTKTKALSDELQEYIRSVDSSLAKKTAAKKYSLNEKNINLYTSLQKDSQKKAWTLANTQNSEDFYYKKQLAAKQKLEQEQAREDLKAREKYFDKLGIREDMLSLFTEAFGNPATLSDSDIPKLKQKIDTALKQGLITGIEGEYLTYFYNIENK